MTPHICFQMMVFNSDHVLGEAIESVREFGPVVAVEGPVDYWQRQGMATSTDRTNAILAHYAIPTIHGKWKEKDEMARAGESLIPADTEFVFVLDADEIWDGLAICKILYLLDSGNWDSMAFSAVSFYGGFDRYMTGFEEDFEVIRIQRWQPGAHWATHRPPTVLAPDGRPWRMHRHLSASQTRAANLRFFHYSYVWPFQMRAKAAYYSDRDPGGTIPDYFERVYLPWVIDGRPSRADIERQYSGVHNWLPSRRGPCYTVPFEGEHPSAIAMAMPRLRQRFAFELKSACGITEERA